MARVLLIANFAAARTERKVADEICRVLARGGLKVEVAETAGPGEAASLARRGLETGVDIIAVYGGDGTAMQAVRGMVGEAVPLGLIPGGTGNLLAGNLRIPRNPRKAAELLLRGKTRTIDLGKVERSDGLHYFAVNCGAGFDAELMAATSGADKRRWGMGAYIARFWQKLSHIVCVPHRITVDGETLEAEAATVMIANCGEIVPPFLRLGNNISMDDGLLDVVVLRATGLVSTAGVLWKMASGVPDAAGSVRYARGKRVVVQTEPERPVQLDGEPWGTTPLEAEVVPGAIKVVVP
ncbi:MAG: diacylglycerol kinase [Gemmatimonadales bacterium]|nr:Putative lipid kinase BmrU [bacterium HR33]GIW51914.1 MAG: diacylglycerol kinase [Gemmatimonadales bacterium]